MDKELALKMLDVIEKMNIENLALKAILLSANRNVSTSKIDFLVEEARRQPIVQDTVRAQWLPLRKTLESDSALEEALKQFLRIAPLSKDVN